MSKNNLAILSPFAQGRSLNNSRWYMGNMMTFLVNSEQTDGAFSMTEYLSTLRTGKEHGISFLSPEEIRQQMPPLAKSLAL